MVVTAQAGGTYLPVLHAFAECSGSQHNHSAESWEGIFSSLFMAVGHPVLVTELTRAREVQRAVMLMLGQFECSIQLERERFPVVVACRSPLYACVVKPR